MNLPGTSYRLRIEARLDNPRWIGYVSSIIGVLLALFVGGFVLKAAGANHPVATYREIFKEGFGTFADWQAGINAFVTGTDCPKGLLCFGPLSDTLVKASPILLTTLACIIAFRMRLWNIGADGQMFLGAWAATGVAVFLLPKTTDRWIMLTAMGLAGTLAGILYGAIPGFLKARLNINEIITTLMLNYVAYKWVEYFVVVGPWSIGDFESTGRFPTPATWPRLTEYAERFPIAAGLTAHPGIFLGIAAALILAWILYRSRWGYEIRVIGNNPNAARYAGISLARNILLVMCLSGGLAGLAGMNEIAALRELNGRFPRGYGFTGVIVAWLARLNPIAAIFVAILFGGLLVGTKLIQPQGIASMLQGVILFVVVGTELIFHYRFQLEKVTTPVTQKVGGVS
ncbi:MAG TPA: ABC transporter permease [Anaerolineales bacterium]|nr:ABC transporter permease [Anaerolineales bacterium]